MDRLPFNDEAIFIKEASTKDVGYVLFTKGHGKVFAFRRNKPKIPGLLVPLNWLLVQLRPHPSKEDAFQLLQVVPKEVFLNLRRSNRKVIIALGFLDIVDKLLPWNEPSPKLYKTLVNLLKYLEKSDLNQGLIGLMFAFLIYTMRLQGLSLEDDNYLRILGRDEKKLLELIASDPLRKLKVLSKERPQDVLKLLRKTVQYLREQYGYNLKSIEVISALQKSLIGK